ncbi:putative colanic acid biosynthesis acetyltransferase [Pseudotamlana carrageenivorans]|uniref:Putative colanic acid biosynthesis acetyltransferase n=1 Tax=Pseudotamlana carrageenivorans TaxID=2069432 RepID=A0A2I7SIV3_9FLAO|nr:putative colanic acid biosynthesis acetyltransferase [Tamlana carrageenivorans]AUS05831.1 putative colanic acid biosynthesis acetyltransferase [Tamlana carrageenivorans]
MQKIDISQYQNTLSKNHQIKRLLWDIVWCVLARPLPRSIGRKWKLFLLRLFGAKVHKTANVYSSVKIYAPWQLEMYEYACLAPEVDCYNVAKITIGAHATVSQKTYLCSASHDINKKHFPLITAPITINAHAWVGASVFIGMGVTVGQGSVVGATASVYKNVAPWSVVGGNPAKFIKKREINQHE